MKKHTSLCPDGYTSVTGQGITIEANTLQCVHCGCHWQMKPGSGNVRGFCFKCNGPICGPKCVKCVPIEQQLENIEKGNSQEHRPIIVSVL